MLLRRGASGACEAPARGPVAAAAKTLNQDRAARRHQLACWG